MNRTREQHNAKARRSVAGGTSRKKGKRRAGRQEQSNKDPVETNTEIYVPMSKEQREAKREKLRQELAAQAESSKMTSKKKKRLEKYIEKKLLKEERVIIFEKLSKTQAQIPTSLNLQSSSTLGTGHVSTNRERLERSEDKEVRRALDGRVGKRKRKGEHHDIVGPAESSEDDDGPLRDLETTGDRQEGVVVVVDSVSGPPPKASEVGAALRRSADGAVVVPKIKKAKLNKNTFQSWNRHSRKQKPVVEQDSDTSFDSSDSAYDSDEDGDIGTVEVDEASIGEEESGDADGSDNPSAEESPVDSRKLGFKDWALKQLQAAKGHGPHADSSVRQEYETLSLPPPTKKRKTENASGAKEMRGPLGEDLSLPRTTLADHVLKKDKPGPSRIKALTVNRPPEVAEARSLLPIIAEEQVIMEAVLLNPVVIICGETGSGKTTQVPQFLYEAGFGSPDSENPGMIGVTQPRRVAAMSMASRVAHELSLTSSRVSYQIRYDATVSPSTSIKFMTDGVLLRELATDFLLSKYSVIIIDEAHERSMNTDILIGVLSRVLKLREDMWKEGKEGAKPLRLIIMSATLRVSDFAENTTLFPTSPPVISVAARQHPVTIHFGRRTAPDYVTEAVKKAFKIHSRLPPGGILIFLTGQNEITGVCKKLEAKYGKRALEEKRKRRRPFQEKIEDPSEQNGKATLVSQAQTDVEAEDLDLGTAEQDVDADVSGDLTDEDSDALESDDERRADEEMGLDVDEIDLPMHVVPLYSLLPSEKQMLVFQPPPTGSRLMVVSTNVAETSLTIPGIRYVIDCGRAKERRYDVANGIQSFQVSWISKASAAQRAGRAGRTGPGHCYRLYSSALFEHYFDSFSQPEILRMPIEGVVLQMKSMHIDAVMNFPFPTPPERISLGKAETVLTHLGAIDSKPALSKQDSSVMTVQNTIGGHITDLGKAMSLFPLSPRFSRMLVSGRQQGCLPYVISIVSALSVGDPFIREEGIDGQDENSEDENSELSHLTSEAIKAKEARKLRRRAFFQSQQRHSLLGEASSDIFKTLSVVGAYEYAGGGHQFCAEHFLRPKAMEEIHKLRAQISNIVQANFPDTDPGFTTNLRPPNDVQLKVLRQLLAAAFIDQVAVRKDLVQKNASTGVQYANAKGVAYRAVGIPEDVFIHPSSVLVNGPPPGYLVFNEIVRTSTLWIKGLTIVNAAWLSALGKGSLCTFSKATKNNSGIMMTIPRFGPEGWELPPVKADM